MRYVLYDSRNDKVGLEQEINFIENYIDLENLRHDKSDLIEFIIQGNVSGIYIEPLIFMPLIENTFKHALSDNNPAGKWVKLILSVDDKELVFQASNATKQEKFLSSDKYSGIGLDNVRRRLVLLYPDKHELVIHDELNIFTVTIIISLE